jgi:hypothetical protein
MSVSSRLLAFIAAVAITAVSFVGPAFAAPSLEVHQATTSTVTR